MKQGNKDTGSRSTYGMSEGDGSAVYIELVKVKAQLFSYGYGLSRKRLIGLDKVEIGNLIAGLCADLFGSGNRADTHNLGTNAGKSASDPGCHGLNTKLLSLLLAHYNDSCSAVIYSGSISCGNHAVGIDGTKLCKAFYGRARSRSFIGIKYYGLLLLFDLNRNDLLLEGSVLDGCAGLLLRP